jgi:ABC-type polysaccharide/polyol phosphate transport system ATPase subunit
MIVAEGVGFRFLFDQQKQVVTPALARIRRRGTETWGLRGVDVVIRRGQGVALIGPSGSGKTTLLRAMARILIPDEGRLTVEGRVASLLSIDAGLLPTLTGRENALFLGVLAGLSRTGSRASVEGVKEQSRLGDAFERPVSSYSQGMRARLGFAVADEIEPEILLLDEVHEALDHEFRGILERRAHEILAAGGVVVAAGHDHEMLSRLCTHSLWLDRGRVRGVGEFEEMRSEYLAATA